MCASLRPRRSVSWRYRAKLSAAVVGLWSAVGTVAALQLYASTFWARSQFPLPQVFWYGLVNSWIKALLTLPVLLVLEAIHEKSVNWWWRLAGYLASAVAFTAVHVAVRPALIPFVVVGGMPGAVYTYFDKVVIGLQAFALDDLWAMACIILAAYAWRYDGERRDRLAHEQQLRTQLAQAELQILKMQLQPHFLFNTLNSIYLLAPQDSGRAQRMIARLSELLRLSLDHVSSDVVPLRDELEIVDAYLEIEKVRFDDRLAVVQNIDEAAFDATVPSMLLQPLVENAVRHGLARRAQGGNLEISAVRRGDRLLIRVVNDVPALAESKSGSGVGLANTRARLRQLFGDDFAMDLSFSADQAILSIDLPFRTDTPSREDDPLWQPARSTATTSV